MSKKELWRWWTQSDQLKAWLCEGANVSTKVGAPYELFWESGHPERNSTKGCVVIAASDEKSLSFTWRGPVPFSDIMNTAPAPTYVKLELSPLDNGGSSITLKHFGWEEGEHWLEARKWQENAWMAAINKLKRIVSASSTGHRPGKS